MSTTDFFLIFGLGLIAGFSLSLIFYAGYYLRGRIRVERRSGWRM